MGYVRRSINRIGIIIVIFSNAKIKVFHIFVVPGVKIS